MTNARGDKVRTAVKRVWHIQDSQGRILALALRGKSLNVSRCSLLASALESGDERRHGGGKSGRQKGGVGGVREECREEGYDHAADLISQERALPTETKVESGTSQSKGGTSFDLSNHGPL